MTYRKRSIINVGCLIKVLVLLAVIMGIVLLINTCSGGSCIRKIDKSLPGITEVPWEVTTPTHLYYAKEASDNGESVTMNVWYEYLSRKWVKHSGNITLEKRIYGEITVRRR
jgi:hypothetical protein